MDTGHPARIESYEDVPGDWAARARELGVRAVVGAPITLEGRLWGVTIATWTQEGPVPVADAEHLLAGFTELVATAIANAESREELASLADEQAALRRVATLVAEGARPEDVFAAVSDEVARTLGVPIAVLLRYDADGLATVLASAGAEFGAAGNRRPIERPSLVAAVFETGRAARVDDFSKARGATAEAIRSSGVRWAVGVPIVVNGALWGVMTAGSRDPEALYGQTENRLAKFTQLLATAIANAESRAELDASRARIVATADATRRRIERDLHDGAQQRLVSLALEVRAVEASVPRELGELRTELSRVAEGHADVLEELREIAQGIHPAILVDDGLGPALRMLARRSPTPVELDLQAETRLPEQVEVAAYYVVSEALANVAKHACASVAHVAVEAGDGMLRVAVRDNGLGGADPALGSGLLGLKDRAEAIGGRISLESLPGAGTSLLVELPVDGGNH
jgi:signal transduction histidine kinase